MPEWFIKPLKNPEAIRPVMADKIGEATFEKQKATPQFQTLKALAIVYLTEHELDRDGAADKAGKYLCALTLTHPN